jgi:trehalose synthase
MGDNGRGGGPPPAPHEVPIWALDPGELQGIALDEDLGAAREGLRWAAASMAGRVLWSVNSTARGGGVAEMLPSLLGYARGAGIDARWMVIGGTPEFFAITKRLHHLLHGSEGDGGPLGEAERGVYEEVLRSNESELAAVVQPGDVVLLHDPQTAGLAPALRDRGAIVVWRSHIGEDAGGERSAEGWRFLAPYLGATHATVFSREGYVPPACDAARVRVIRPSIDTLSAKNYDMDEEGVRAILARTGLIQGGDGDAPIFRARDGSPRRLNHGVDVVALGSLPAAGAPVVVQISRWDPLKDHLGVMRAFARIEPGGGRAPELILAGPNVMAVADDPEAPATLAAIADEWRALPHEVRRRVHLASLPMADLEENAAIVNALQRRAALVVQKSLREGFGLTVTEAMWKRRPVVAGAVGGIRDQIVDGETGVLVDDPADLDAVAAAIGRLLADADEARRLGEAARERVRREFLAPRHLGDYVDLLKALLDA